jgi:hypothetical protein
VWSNKDKSFFIDTILREYPFPEIYWADGKVDTTTGASTTMIVDGQQRVSTLVEYFTGDEDFRLSPEITPYAELSEEQKKKFLNYVVVVRHLGDLSKEKVIDVFNRINITSYNLNSMEINNAVYDGPLKKLAEGLAQSEFFSQNRIFKPMQLKRMGDVRYTLTVLVSMMDGYFNRDEKLEEYLALYNDVFPREEEIRKRFEDTAAYIETCGFSEKSRVWQQSDLLCLFTELDALLMSEPEKLNPGETFERVSDFFLMWTDYRQLFENKLAMAYDRASVQAANDRVNRVRRGKILRAVLLGEANASTTLDFKRAAPIEQLPLFESERDE